MLLLDLHLSLHEFAETEQVVPSKKAACVVMNRGGEGKEEELVVCLLGLGYACMCARACGGWRGVNSLLQSTR